MSVFLGMDPEQVRAFAEDCTSHSRHLTVLRSRLDSRIGSVPWDGQDATAFRRDWDALASGRLSEMAISLGELSRGAHGQADHQDVVSEQDGTTTGPASGPDTIPSSPGGSSRQGYRHADIPWLRDGLEDPLESATSSLAADLSAAIGWGTDTLFDGATGFGDALGLTTCGIDQLRRDTDDARDTLEDWATGERVPTIAEVLAGGALAAGSAGVAAHELGTGRDSPLLDDRRGGIVHAVTTSDEPVPSPHSLQDLVLGNNALRSRGADSVTSGQVGIQEVTSAHGGAPSYIVQVPPTEGASIGDAVSWGAQGNSRDWASNLRLVAGQQPAAMDDVRAAMDAADIPPGSNVMLVGHSQGGIIGAHLAADPTFNSSSGRPGTYNVTHALALGSPTRTVLPAQDSTEVVTVVHQLAIPGQGQLSGDPIPQLDLQGRQIGGGHLGGPNVHEVTLPGHPAAAGRPWLAANHDSVGHRPDGSVDSDAGYAGTVGRATHSDPTLSALEQDLTGRYLGDGTVITRSTVVDVGREDLR